VTGDHEAYVADRFDAVESRFKGEVAADDVRLRAVLGALGPIEGRRVLDLGCGKGRFAAHLTEAGAEVVGLDVSKGMLGKAGGLDRVRGSAKRLPFADRSFDGVIAIEVIEHVGAVGPVLAEARRVLRPGGRLAIVDKNLWALDARRPWLPSVVIKRIDERRGLWMYPSGGPVAERWFCPGRLKRRLERDFRDVTIAHLLRPEEAGSRIFEAIPGARLMVLWSGIAPEIDPRLQLTSWKTIEATVRTRTQGGVIR
jgi:SAM-dependent methyltransferase